jgi:hypothetical protein
MNTKLDPALEKESKKVQELVFYLRCCKAAFWAMSFVMIINIIVLWGMITGKIFGPLFQPSKPSLRTCTSTYNTFRPPIHLSTETWEQFCPSIRRTWESIIQYCNTIGE